MLGLLKTGLMAALLLLVSCSSGPRPQHDPVEQARQIQAFADRLEQVCLDRNLTIHPYPHEGDHAVAQSCTMWRRARGSSDFDNRFFVYQNHHSLVNELKHRFGVIYHRQIGTVGVCEVGREHYMLLRDGETVLNIVYQRHANNGAYCNPRAPEGRWQEVMVRLSKACAFESEYGMYYLLACGDSRRSPYMRTAWYGTNVGNSPEDIVIARQSVLNLARLSVEEIEQQQLAQQSRDADEAWLLGVAYHIDGIDHFIERIASSNQSNREHNQAMLQRVRQEREARYQAISAGIMQGLQSGQANIAESLARHETFAADVSREWQRQQYQNTLQELTQRPQFDAAQLLPYQRDPSQTVRQPSSMSQTESHALSTQQVSKSISSRAAQSSAATPAQPQATTADKPNQCWFHAEPPLSSCIETNTFENRGDLIIVTTNRCSRRIYARSCGARTNAPEFCAVSGLLPGQSWSHKVYKSWQPTGQYRNQWVGSESPAEDWICADKAQWQR
ncbi:hypothetical protein Q3O60_04620 [Alkalimonas collagenimarina]|uniref:Lipoprotein n=1 Tax=Alkalimonas collagenimarina TaxID=400390 RepID=A0ABT9GWN5_9GAMM|nr:hypothetical protein [Alkalimonas collagenimarina]MDP4535473.1 hypothetical protein [Alkalimonas collagenimarina]